MDMKFHKTGSVGLVLHQDGAELGIAISRRSLSRIREGVSMTIKGAGLVIGDRLVQDVWGFNTIERGSVVVDTVTGQAIAASSFNQLSIIEN